MVQAYMNAQSFVGIEYIHILNKAINSPDCNNSNIKLTSKKFFNSKKFIFSMPR